MEFVFASLNLALAYLTVSLGCKLVCSLWLVHINFACTAVSAVICRLNF